jgi:hypothetical protein
MHIFGGDSDGAQPQRTGADRTTSDEAEDSDFVFYDDGIEWQRAMSKPDDSEFWHYYPFIPRNAQPGETIVLGASAIGFQGWEVDENFAAVELFDETFADGNAYVSFIMPNEKVSIAALYDEMPYANLGSELDSFAGYVSPEHGQAIAPASDDLIPGIPLNGTVGIDMNVDLFDVIATSTHPDAVAARQRIANVRGNVGMMPPEVSLPLGLSYEAVDVTMEGVPSQFWVSGPPQSSLDLIYNFRLVALTTADPWTEDTDPPVTHQGWEIGQIIGLVPFRFIIMAAEDPPDFFLTSRETAMPAGMRNVPYVVDFDTVNLPDGVVWEWTVTGGWLPPGFVLEFDRNNFQTAKITGTQTTAPAAAPYTFSVNLTTRSPIPNVQKLFSITMWEQPFISPGIHPDQTPPLITGREPMILYDGIANTNNRHPYNVTLNAAGNALDTFPTGPSDPVPPRGANVEWRWSIINGDLPPGLSIPLPTSPDLAAKSLLVTGVPTLAEDIVTAREFSFTARYEVVESDRNVLIGAVERDFTIRILPPPQFSTGSDLHPGMDWRPRYPRDPSDLLEEPEDEPYIAHIRAGRFLPTDEDVEWKWSEEPGALPPGDTSAPERNMRLVQISDDFGTITGMPQTRVDGVSQDYTFTIEMKAQSDNPNINDAVISQSFTIRIWARRYIYLDFENPRRDDGFVRRVTDVSEDPRNPGREIPVWDTPLWISTSDAENYRMRRAVMPGTEGEIRVELPGSRFVRWEVRDPNPDLDPSLGSPLTPNNANRFAHVGGPASSPTERGYRTNTTTNFAYLVIQMPTVFDTTTTIPGNRSSRDNDIYIRAIMNARQPVWTRDLNNGKNMEGDNTSVAVITLATQDVGHGGREYIWQELHDTEVPPGMYLDPVRNVAFIRSMPGGPFEGEYVFTLGLTLPGSMRLDEEFRMTILRDDGPMLGDLDGNGERNLADLILFARFLNNEVRFEDLPNPEAVNIASAKGSVPGRPDFVILSAWFARQDAELRAPANSDSEP